MITGAKSMSLCGDANGAVVFARTSDEGRGRGITAFVVDLNQPGVTKEPYSDMGTKAVARGAVHFDHVRVPAENMLGEVGKGFTQVMQGFDFSRALIGLQCVGTRPADRRRDLGVRVPAGGVRPADQQEPGCLVPAGRGRNPAHRSTFAVLPDAVAQGRRPAAHRRGGHVQVVGPKTAYDVINTCLLLHGQYGYRTEKPIEQRLRDVLGLQIGDGTAQIMKLIISRQKLGRALAP